MPSGNVDPGVELEERSDDSTIKLGREIEAEEDMSDNNTIRLSRVLCDFLVLTIIAIPLLIFHEFVKPYKRGYYCDDETIRYPFQKSTVSRQMLIVIGLLIPILLILATELFRTMAWEKKCEDEFKTYQVRNHSVHRLIVRLYCFIGYFFVGVCFNQLMVDIAKYTIGRQRPHFMDVCRPNIGYEKCTEPDTYVTEFTCTGTDAKLIHEAQLSFYSGHAAFSFYAAWFTSLYLQARLFRPLFSRLLLPVIQFLLFGGAAYVALTRVSDYKHHWSDVLVGAIMGSAIGIFVALFVAEVFKRREIPNCGSPNEFGLIRMDRPDAYPSTNGAGNGAGTGTVVTTQHVVVSEVQDPANQRLNGWRHKLETRNHASPLPMNTSGNDYYQNQNQNTVSQQVFNLGPPTTSNGYKTELRLDPVIIVNVKD